MYPKTEHTRLALLAADPGDEQAAERLAQRLALPHLPTGYDLLCCAAADAVLIVSGTALSLQQTGRGVSGPVAVNFGSATMRHRRRSGNNELLGRAVGIGKKTPLRILDATAGLGRDSFILADLGCELMLCEREPVIVELLRSGLDIANASGDSWLLEVMSRMQLRPGDVRQMPPADLQGIDVIYLDPMFEQRSKSAAVKKEMALFQFLLKPTGDVQDADALLYWALHQGVARVVVKRAARAPQLGGVSPSHCIRGKAVRYDVHVHRGLA